MKTRIKEIRESLVDEYGRKLSQAKFAEKIGVSVSSAQKWEIGAAVPNSATIKLIAERCGFNETWLRTGEGEPKAPGNRPKELKEAVERLFADDSAEFQQALISALLQFDPHGPQWRVVEEIFRAVAAEVSPTPRAEAEAPTLEDLHKELDEHWQAEKGETGKSAAL